MAGKMILTIGVPGCGKSTWANKMKAADLENVVIVERDATRTTLFTEKYHKGNFPKKSEDEVTRVNQELTRKALREGKTVIISDTNINPRNVQGLVKMGRDYGAEVSFEHFDVDPEECKRRNRARGAAGGREVPDFVMDRMIKQAYGDDGHLKEMKIASKTGQVFAVPQSTPGSRLIDKFNRKAEFEHPFADNSVVLLDLDGTLFNNSHDAQRFLHQPERKQFDKFYNAVAHAPVNTEVRDLVNRMRDEEGVSIVVLTGRDDSHAEVLLKAIKKSGAKVSRVITKREGDYRPDVDFKNEAITKLRDEGLVILHGIDDREGSIRTLESHGILVSRVDTPTFAPNTDLRKPAPEPKVNTIYGQGVCIRCGQLLKSGGNIGPKCRLK